MSDKYFSEGKANPEAGWVNSYNQDCQYGCIFCRTGQERFVAQAITEKFEGIQALAVTQVKHKSANGVKSLEECILLQGYVLFKVYGNVLPCDIIKKVQGTIKLLRNTSGQWRLSDEDYSFAHWVFENGGMIGVSKAYAMGDRVKILGGPLKDFEGSIIKIDRRSRNGQVAIRFNDKIWKVWLAFEIVDVL